MDVLARIVVAASWSVLLSQAATFPLTQLGQAVAVLAAK